MRAEGSRMVGVKASPTVVQAGIHLLRRYQSRGIAICFTHPWGAWIVLAVGKALGAVVGEGRRGSCRNGTGPRCSPLSVLWSGRGPWPVIRSTNPSVGRFDRGLDPAAGGQRLAGPGRSGRTAPVPHPRAGVCIDGLGDRLNEIAFGLEVVRDQAWADSGV